MPSPNHALKKDLTVVLIVSLLILFAAPRDPVSILWAGTSCLGMGSLYLLVRKAGRG